MVKSDNKKDVEEEKEIKTDKTECKERKHTIVRLVVSMVVFTVVSLNNSIFECISLSIYILFQIVTVLTTCLVITGAEEEDFSNFYDIDNFTFDKTSYNSDNEVLPQSSAQLGPEARNYVAYIPVPINEGEEEEDDEYYDEDDEYYYEDEEYYEEEPPKKSKPKRKKYESTKRRPNRRKYQEDSSKDDKERVPFLVPLMMVPENQVGVEKEFSFGQTPNRQTNDPSTNSGDDVFTSILNLNNKDKPPFRNRIPSNIGKGIRGPPARNVHNVPGPPYRGPHPRNPNLPMDKTIIHPSNLRPRFRRPPRNFRPRPQTTTVSTTTTTTTTTETSTKAKPSIIVVQQQPSYNPYQPSPYNPYPPVYQPYYPQQPYPYQPQPTPYPTTAQTTTVSTTTTTTTTTTTKKPKKKRRKKKPQKYKSNLTDDQITSLSQPQLQIVNNKVVPVMSQQQQSILTKRFGLPALQSRRFNTPYKVRGRRRFPHKMGMSGYDPKMPYIDKLDRRVDVPNIFSQSGYPYDTYGEERPIINRPPPRHPGVKVPGVRVPANAGSIEDIISPKPVSVGNKDYPGFRPPIRPTSNNVDYSNPPYRPPPSSHSHNDNSYFTPEDEYGPIVPDYAPPPPLNHYSPPPRQYQTTTPRYSQPTTKKYGNGRPPIRYTNNEPVQSYDKEPYRPPPNNYQPPKKYEPPPSNYQPPKQYEPPPPSYQEPDKYAPPPSNSFYEEPPYKEPEVYRPKPPTTVVPPAYNQDYYLTSDPQNDIYPGPDIYDGGSIHGPSITDRDSKYQDQNKYTYQEPTLGPPTRRPGYSNSKKYDTNRGTYERPKDYNSYSYDYEPDKYDSYEKPDIYEESNKYNSYERPNRYQEPNKYDSYERPNKYESNKPYKKPYEQNTIDKFSDVGYHPDGPDYSSGTVVHNKGSTPFKVGVDLYPMGGVSPLGNFGKQDIYSSVLPSSGHDDNKHEILLHLNLFSKKPSVFGGRRSDIDIDSRYVGQE